MYVCVYVVCTFVYVPGGPKNGVTWSEPQALEIPIKFIDLYIIEICSHKVQISWPVAMATIYVHLVEVALMYEVDANAEYWLMANFARILNVTMWPWPFDLGVLSQCHLGDDPVC